MLGNFRKKLALQLKVFTIFTGPAATANQAESPRHRADQPTVSPQSARHLASQPATATASHSPAQPSPSIPYGTYLRKASQSFESFMKFYEDLQQK